MLIGEGAAQELAEVFVGRRMANSGLCRASKLLLGKAADLRVSGGEELEGRVDAEEVGILRCKRDSTCSRRAAAVEISISGSAGEREDGLQERSQGVVQFGPVGLGRPVHAHRVGAGREEEGLYGVQLLPRCQLGKQDPLAFEDQVGDGKVPKMGKEAYGSPQEVVSVSISERRHDMVVDGERCGAGADRRVGQVEGDALGWVQQQGEARAQSFKRGNGRLEVAGAVGDERDVVREGEDGAAGDFGGRAPEDGIQNKEKQNAAQRVSLKDACIDRNRAAGSRRTADGSRASFVDVLDESDESLPGAVGSESGRDGFVRDGAEGVGEVETGEANFGPSCSRFAESGL